MSELFQPDLFTPKDGRERRNDGIAKVRLNNQEWMAAAILLLHHLPSGWRGLPEDWRGPITKALGAPTDPHAWGALTLEVIKRGLLKKTGKRLPMRSPESNARMTDQYYRP